MQSQGLFVSRELYGADRQLFSVSDCCNPGPHLCYERINVFSLGCPKQDKKISS